MRLEAVGKRYGLRQPWIVRDVTLGVPGRPADPPLGPQRQRQVHLAARRRRSVPALSRSGDRPPAHRIRARAIPRRARLLGP
jgi:hypothetical protein